MSNCIYSDLITVRDWVRWGASRFTEAKLYFGHGTDNAWDEALVLVLWSIHQPWDQLEHIIDARLTESEKQKIEQLFNRRVDERIPAAYLTGEAWFAGLKFAVNEDVLVPRSPIAELIQNGFEPWLAQYPTRILDLCTGSGCIGVACALYFEDAQVDLSDISEKALSVAGRNIEAYSLQERVTPICSDGLDNLGGRKYDLIVSNPPYVDLEDLTSMPDEYHAEPEIGLGSGTDGLDFTRRLLEQAADHLTENGLLVVEVGNSFVALEEAYPEVSFMWPELENGGHGVFVLTRDQLLSIKN